MTDSTSPEPPEDDVRQTIEALRATVRREAGYLSGEDIPAPAVSSALSEAVDLSVVSAHLPVRSNTPIVGPAVVFVRRLMRLALRWYVNPIIEQQNAFNEAVVRALIQIERRQTQLERRIAQTSSDERSDQR